MKNTFGNSVSITLFGESHGEEIGAILDGMAPGITIDEDFIRHQLSLRAPISRISTSRVEPDDFVITSGVYNGKTTGAPICILIPNEDVDSSGYNKETPRPGHADYSAQCKYHGFQDFRGGGHFSGRLTAPIVAAGAICLQALMQNGIFLGTHILSIGQIQDRTFIEPQEDIEILNDLPFPVLDEETGEEMRAHIEYYAKEQDSVGGILETCVVGMPSGVGEPWFDSMESMLSHALFSIPAVKGVEFGDGFDFAEESGHLACDAIRTDGKSVYTTTNHNGGINGGITNGMPIIFRTCVKPTPSVGGDLQTINMETMKNETITIEGRHDPCIVHRARVVVDSLAAITLCDMLALRYGTDFPDIE